MVGGQRAAGGEAHAYKRGELVAEMVLGGERVHDWASPEFEIAGFDETTGKRSSSPVVLTDFLNCGIGGWVIVSSRVRDLLANEGIGPEQVQWLDVCLHYDGRDIVGEYFVANILVVRKAAHPTASKFVGPARILAKIVLSRQAVQGLDLFRLAESKIDVYFSERLKRVLDSAGVTGADWRRTEVRD